MVEPIRKILQRIKGAIIRRLVPTEPVAPAKDCDALDNYTSEAPSDQAILSIFKGEWVSIIPGYDSRGYATLFGDDRINWVGEQCGGFSKKTILELGPLEGGHTYMLWKAGAASIVSIESNKKAFLKCLITKELLGYSSKLLYGDFTKYLEATDDRYDFLLASGILYHMVDPIRVLEDMSRVSDRIGVWTHYFDHNIISNSPGVIKKFDLAGTPIEWRGRTIFTYRQQYFEALAWGGFCGGSAPFSDWLKKEDIIGIFGTLGFSTKVLHETLDHPNGPAILLYAERNNIPT